jgi:hypothetical protein
MAKREIPESSGMARGSMDQSVQDTILQSSSGMRAMSKDIVGSQNKCPHKLRLISISQFHFFLAVVFATLYGVSSWSMRYLRTNSPK